MKGYQGQPPLSKVAMQEAVDALQQHSSVLMAARALKLPYNTLRHRLREAKTQGIVARGTDPRSAGALALRIQRLEADLRRAQVESADAAALKRIIGTAALNLSSYKAPEWTAPDYGVPDAPGVPTLFLSDFHWGEVVKASQIGGVNTYDLAIAKERLSYTVNTAIHLLRILEPQMRYPGIVVGLGGDMISGNIHEELQATNELNTMPTLLDLYGELRQAIELLAETFGHVFLPCVSGNHGRDTRKTWAKDRNHTSFDWLLYHFLAKHFEGDKRVTFYIPDGPDARFRIFNHTYLLTHGDQFRGGDGLIGPLGPLTRGDHKKRARNSQIGMDYDTMICGHFHTLMMLMRLIVNGSLKGYDEYAFANNFPFEEAMQALWITHAKYGITWRMPVHAARGVGVPKAKWVSVQA